MSRPKTMPDDVKKACISFVQGYNRRNKTAQSKLEIQRVRAVEHAIQKIRSDIPESSRQSLASAIILNCQSGKKYPFRVLNIDGFSERGFYRERDKFLLDIAKFMDLL